MKIVPAMATDIPDIQFIVKMQAKDQRTVEKPLKYRIYDSISSSKLVAINSVLRNSQKKTQKKFNPYSSEYVAFRSEGDGSQIAKHKTQVSLNDSENGQKKQKRKFSGERKYNNDKIVRNASEKSLRISKKKPQPATKSEKSEKLYPNYLLSTLSKLGKLKVIKQKLRGASQQASIQKQICLQSILEQSSPKGHIFTPSSKKNSLHKSKSKSKKEGRHKNLSKRLSFELDDKAKRQIVSSFKASDKFQRIYDSQLVSVSYRILKYRLLEIQICPHRQISNLHVALQKGNSDCQGINEQYSNVAENSIVTLLTSIRALDCDKSLYDFPMLELSVSQDKQGSNQSSKAFKSIPIPYCWLHFIERKFHPQKSSNSRNESPTKVCQIKTKTFVEGLPLKKHTLNIINSIFNQGASLSKNKKPAAYSYKFMLEDCAYQVRVLRAENCTYSLEIEGRGEDRMLRLLQFLSNLLA